MGLATIVILLSPSFCDAVTSSTNDYRDFEEIHVVQDDRASRKDFLDEISIRILEAACRSDKVVVRATRSFQDCQDLLVRRLIDGGVSQENITVVRLATKERDGSFYRTNYCTWRPKTVLAWSEQINHNKGRQITTTRNTIHKFTIYKNQFRTPQEISNYKNQSRSIMGIHGAKEIFYEYIH